MSIPRQREIYRPLLENLSRSRTPVHLSTLYEVMAVHFQISKEEREVRLEKSGYKRFDNRVAWAVATLKRFGLLERPRYGYYQVTQKGKDELGTEDEINYKYLLNKYGDEPDDTLHSTQQVEGVADLEITSQDDEESPDEEIERALQRYNTVLENDILKRLRDSEFDNDEFEHLTVNLLLAMGYGKSGKKTPSSRDGGIDGIINEDGLGLSQIGIQAKRYSKENKVSGDRVNAFVGALDRLGLQKGCIITTSSFTSDAHEAAKEVNKSIRLIDGAELAKLMREHNVGCKEKISFNMKEIDENFPWPEQEHNEE